MTLVESDAIGTIGVGESTIPPLITFNRLLGIGEAEFMAATQATFKLGIQFDGWKGPDDSYFHAFGLTGKDHWAAGFQHFWLDGQARGHAEPYDDYCLELVAAREGKFAHLPDDRMSYAYQLDSTLYGVSCVAWRRATARRGSKAGSPRSTSTRRAATSPRCDWTMAGGSRATCSSTAPVSARS